MKKRKLIVLLIVLLCLCILGALVSVGYLIWDQTVERDRHQILEDLRDQLKNPVTVEIDTVTETEAVIETETAETEPITAEPPETVKIETLPVETYPPETELVETEPPVTEPAKQQNTQTADTLLDFSYMWKTNSDICAWIEIDGTMVNYPILQSPTDDEKYLTTAFDGSYYIGGSLFTQATYNSKDFNDPVTIVYGHTMRSGALFGQLQPIYSTSSGFASHSEIKLYLPGEIRHYTVFAAVPYSNMHILAAYDFSNEKWYRQFFDSIMDTRAFGAQFNPQITPEPTDRVLILSTCLNEDSTKRFLVMAIYQEDIG